MNEVILGHRWQIQRKKPGWMSRVVQPIHNAGLWMGWWERYSWPPQRPQLKLNTSAVLVLNLFATGWLLGVKALELFQNNPLSLVSPPQTVLQYSHFLNVSVLDIVCSLPCRVKLENIVFILPGWSSMFFHRMLMLHYCSHVWFIQSYDWLNWCYFLIRCISVMSEVC